MTAVVYTLLLFFSGSIWIRDGKKYRTMLKTECIIVIDFPPVAAILCLSQLPKYLAPLHMDLSFQLYILLQLPRLQWQVMGLTTLLKVSWVSPENPFNAFFPATVCTCICQDQDKACSGLQGDGSVFFPSFSHSIFSSRQYAKLKWLYSFAEILSSVNETLPGYPRSIAISTL